MFNYFDEKVDIGMVLLIIWSLLWKCYSAWLAGKHNHKKWFVALIVLNTVGILDMIYIFGYLKKKPADVKKAFLNLIS
jgi:methionyl-tRNA synthetase